MRLFEHAAADRSVSEAIVVRLELSDGSVGWGETLPRRYVTGETLDTVPVEIERQFRMLIESKRLDYSILPDSPADILAARCGLEIALEDALARSESVKLAGPIGRDVRVSGVIGSTDPSRTAKSLRLMRLFGLRDFKLKVGFDEQIDAENIRIVQSRLARTIRRGKCTLRADVNGAWGIDEVPERVDELKSLGFCAVEQPVFCTADEFIELARKCTLPLIADESLVTLEDAEKIVAKADGKIWLNVRISKNGGIDLSGRIIALASRAGVPFIVGCMVGETSILSAAQRVLISRIPTPRFVEGNYGRFLLSDDIASRTLQIGFGGRIKPPKGVGLGIEIEQKKLADLAKRVKTIYP